MAEGGGWSKEHGHKLSSLSFNLIAIDEIDSEGTGRAIISGSLDTGDNEYFLDLHIRDGQKMDFIRLINS